MISRDEGNDRTNSSHGIRSAGFIAGGECCYLVQIPKRAVAMLLVPMGQELAIQERRLGEIG